MRYAFAHVCLRVRDLAATEDFYVRILGLKKRFTFRRKGEPIGFYLGLGRRTFIEVFRDGHATPGNTIAHLCLACDDLDAARATLVGHGVAVTEKQLGCDGSWQVWLKDPDGIPIEIHQYTEASAQLRPRDVEVTW
jgi:catechol 2,3-dioxygenase-like lactoylglutathione lyase family enzyme